jgi:hypothetical protein
MLKVQEQHNSGRSWNPVEYHAMIMACDFSLVVFDVRCNVVVERFKFRMMGFTTSQFNGCCLSCNSGTLPLQLRQKVQPKQHLVY